MLWISCDDIVIVGPDLNSMQSANPGVFELLLGVFEIADI